MSEIDNHLKDIAEIREMMERSSKFLSLSGLSGISVGIVALIGAVLAYPYLQPFRQGGADLVRTEIHLAGIAIGVLVLSLCLGVFFSIRMARKKGLPVWNKTSQYMVVSLFSPLVIGGIFCLALLKYGFLDLLAPFTLIIYGISLLSASRYTVKELQYLAYCEALLGLIAVFMLPLGIILWGIGFGILHITYGIFIYLKYEK
jgi:hypothetical protein